jgi:hypothetical protein
MLRLGEERLRFSVGTNGLARDNTPHRYDESMITYSIGSGLSFDMEWGSSGWPHHLSDSPSALDPRVPCDAGRADKAHDLC